MTRFNYLDILDKKMRIYIIDKILILILIIITVYKLSSSILQNYLLNLTIKLTYLIRKNINLVSQEDKEIARCSP